MKNGEHPETPHPEKPAATPDRDGVMMYGKIGTGQVMRVVFLRNRKGKRTMSDSQIKPQELQLQIIGKPEDGTEREEKFVLAMLFAQWEAKLANTRIKRIEDAFRAGRLPTVEELDAMHDGKAMLGELLNEFHSLGTGFRVEAKVDGGSDESEAAT